MFIQTNIHQQPVVCYSCVLYQLQLQLCSEDQITGMINKENEIRADLVNVCSITKVLSDSDLKVLTKEHVLAYRSEI